MVKHLSLRNITLCVFWLWLLSSCGKASMERAEDDVCAAVAKDYSMLTPGPMKDSVWAVVVSCDAEELAEHQDAGK